LRRREAARILSAMPAKKQTLSDEERARRLQETAREIEADETGEAFERAFKKIVQPKLPKGERAPKD
jgi:5'-3' exonuclease